MIALGIIIFCLTVALTGFILFAYGMSDAPESNSSSTPMSIFSIGSIISAILIIIGIFT